MDRLTHKESTKCSMSPWDWCGLDKDCKRDCFNPEPCRIPELARRLAEYEDTGLVPHDITALQIEVERMRLERRAEIQVNGSLRAELEQVRRERDAAVANSQCGCGICLAHNGMVCPKMRGASEQEAQG